MQCGAGHGLSHLVLMTHHKSVFPLLFIRSFSHSFIHHVPGLLTADPVLLSKGETEAGSCEDRWPQGGPVQGVHREKDTETQRAEGTRPGLGAHSLCPTPRCLGLGRCSLGGDAQSPLSPISLGSNSQGCSSHSPHLGRAERRAGCFPFRVSGLSSLLCL